MGKSKVVLLVGVLVVAVMLATAACGQQKPSSTSTQLPVLKVGSEVAYAPFEAVDPKTGNFVGFDIDLIKAIGKAAGMDVQIQNIAWDGLIPALQQGQVDLVISAMTITDQRAQRVLFSDPYFTTGQVIGVKAGSNVKTPDDLKGKKVGVQANTTGDYAASAIPGVNVVRYETTPDAFNALKNGEVDAVVVDEMTLAAYLQENPNSGIVKAAPPFTVEYYGMAMRKNDTALAQKINQALAQVKASGEYQKIYDTWLTPLLGQH